MTWVEEMITKMEASVNGVMQIKIGDQLVVAQVTQDAVDYFKANRILLEKVGKSVFRSFLLLINEKKQEQAFNLLLAQMDAEDIIARLNSNSASLGQSITTNEQFVHSLTNFALTKLAPALVKVLIGLLLA